MDSRRVVAAARHWRAGQWLADGSLDSVFEINLQCLEYLVGNPNQFNYTALGHTVVVASRLNSVTPAGEVLVSDTVYQLIADAFVVEACEEVMVPEIISGSSKPTCSKARVTA